MKNEIRKQKNAMKTPGEKENKKKKNKRREMDLGKINISLFYEERF
jgi:hypothetical protein